MSIISIQTPTAIKMGVISIANSGCISAPFLDTGKSPAGISALGPTLVATSLLMASGDKLYNKCYIQYLNVILLPTFANKSQIEQIIDIVNISGMTKAVCHMLTYYNDQTRVLILKHKSQIHQKESSNNVRWSDVTQRTYFLGTRLGVLCLLQRSQPGGR